MSVPTSEPSYTKSETKNRRNDQKGIEKSTKGVSAHKRRCTLQEFRKERQKARTTESQWRSKVRNPIRALHSSSRRRINEESAYTIDGSSTCRYAPPKLAKAVNSSKSSSSQMNSGKGLDRRLQQ